MVWDVQVKRSLVAVPLSGWNKTAAHPFVMDLGSVSTEAASIFVANEAICPLSSERWQKQPERVLLSEDGDKKNKSCCDNSPKIIINRKRQNVDYSHQGRSAKIQRGSNLPSSSGIPVRVRGNNHISEIRKQLERENRSLSKRQLFFNWSLQRRKALDSNIF